MKKLILFESLFMCLLILSSCQQTPPPTERKSAPEKQMRTQVVPIPQTRTQTSETRSITTESTPAGIIIKNSQAMLVMKDATLTPIKTTMALDDGTQIKPTGEIISQNQKTFSEISELKGDKHILKEGAMITKKGDIAFMGSRSKILDESPIAGFGRDQRTVFFIMKDGTKKVMANDTILMNGLEIKTNGQVSGPNRDTIALQNGQMVNLMGDIKALR